MRKLKAAGIFAAGALGLSLVASGPASAAATTYIIDGTFSGVLYACTQITFAFSGSDCSYGRNRLAANGTWLGPLFGGANYPKDSAQSALTYLPTSGDNVPQGSSAQANFIPATPDGKLNAPLDGELSIDDNGTPGDPTDDIVSGSFTIGALARNVPTGQFTRAVQQWTTMDNTLVPTPVNATATVANGAGGVDYVVGSRGFPTPRCYRYNAANCFPTEDSVPDFGDARFWGPLPPAGSVGIEASGLLGDPAFVPVQPPPTIPTGNVGASTTATFTGASCATNNGASDDCAVSPLIWGAGEDPGFDNLIMKISTNNSGQITSALVYWTQEYFIGAFTNPVEAGYNNSVAASTINFTGEIPQPTAQDFAASVLQGSSNNSLNAGGNCIRFTPPVSVNIVTPPTLGTASVVGPVGTQTISYDSTGAAGTDSIVYSCTSGAETDSGTITITVAPDSLPVSPSGGITISTQGAAPGPGTAGSLIVSTLPSYSAGNAPALVSISTPPNAVQGTATVNSAAKTVTFTPSATFFEGSAQFSYVLTDNDGDVSSPAGVITVTIPNVSPAIQDGTITTDQNRASTAQALAITPGNGTIAQGLVTVTTNASNGSCTITGTAAAPTLTYTPAADYAGPDSCVVTATDGDGSTDTGTFSITVNAVDDALKLPGGGSAVDLWSLSLLGTLPLLRRRRRA
ncbi:MAG: hypothetical protein EXR82_01140 [Gammaproteobacteria bacterium]|nr:hypothetical protein [Gammaproteobacteria bacterium]